MSKTKEVAIKEQNHMVAAPPQLVANTVDMTKEEKLYSVARLIHGMSKKENKENPYGPAFVQGDMVLYPSRTKIGDLNKPFNVIFLRNTLEWANFEEVAIGGKTREEWRSEEPRTTANEALDFEYVHDGKKMKRYRQVTLYVLLPDQAEEFLKASLSDDPSLGGSCSPVAIKSRNFSRKFAQQILNVIGGPEFNARNAVRARNGLAPFQVYDYEHTVAVNDFTNKNGDTFPILVYKKSMAVRNPRVKEIAADFHAMISREQNLQTVVVEDDQAVRSSSVTGEVSDLV